MDDGQPLPSPIEDDIVWRVVHRLPDGKTLWRKIFLVHAREMSPTRRGILGGMSKDTTS
jgi:hypothetical protein